MEIPIYKNPIYVYYLYVKYKQQFKLINKYFVNWFRLDTQKIDLYKIFLGNYIPDNNNNIFTHFYNMNKNSYNITKEFENILNYEKKLFIENKDYKMKSSNIENYIKENTNLKGIQKFVYLDTFNICMIKDRIHKKFNKEEFIQKYKKKL